MSGQMGGLAAQATALAVLAALLAGCTPHTPPSFQQRYLAQRVYMVNPNEPCTLEPYPLTQIKVIRNNVFVPVTINGVHTIGKLDTGANVSMITPALAAAAHAASVPGHLSLMGISGAFTADTALLDSLQVGSINYHGKRIAHVYPFLGLNNTQIGALVGLDWLDRFDFDLDFQHERMRPFRAQNCAEIPVPWHDSYTGLALTRGIVEGLKKQQQEAAAIWGFGYHISIPVAFQGGLVEATVDTGAPRSFLSYQAARDAGVTAAQLGADAALSIPGTNGTARRVLNHRFADLAIGEEELHEFSILVAPTFYRWDPAMILGMDYLGSHHLWLSLTTNALYIDSGEPRKLIPPWREARQVGGAKQPGYPHDAVQVSGLVRALCFVEIDGRLSDCRVTDDGGDPAFGRATMAWLTGAAAPVMQPAHQNGAAVRESYHWIFSLNRPQPALGPFIFHDARPPAR